MTALLKPFAESKPDQVALIDERGETSWQQLNTRSNQIIHALRAIGLKKGDTVAVLAGNRREYFELITAFSQAGWRYVPINWHLQLDEVTYIADNAEIKALFFEDRFRDLVQAVLHRVPSLQFLISMDASSDGASLSYLDIVRTAQTDEPLDLFFGAPMFYTSGTTGRPKGVVRPASDETTSPHPLKLLSQGIIDTLGIQPDGTLLLAGPLYHSAQWLFTVPLLLSGSCVVTRSKFDAAQTLQLIDHHRITNINLVPTQFVRLLKVDARERARFDGGSLEAIWHGGAPCALDIKRRMIDWMGPIIHEFYGSTEGSIISLIRSGEWLERPGSVGRPFDHIETIVMTADGQRAPVGESGEIYFRNRTGDDFEYYKDPAKTESAHLEPGVFTVGDVGYLDTDGYLYLNDRRIDMIISGGVNIYPREVEDVLATHESVADAAVFGIPNEEFGEEVKAAVQLETGHTESDQLADDLISYCRERLAHFKAPKSIDFHENLGRQENGKLQKKRLKDPYWASSDRRI